MNPDGTNPATNTGATGGSSTGVGVPPALDFVSSDPSSTTNLSMADSLASAADNLTSAGMAAKELDNGSMDMSEITASDPSATMERPNEPLVPAAPVPGSIGSVTSGPALTTTDTSSDLGASTQPAVPPASVNGLAGSASSLNATSSASNLPTTPSAGLNATPSTGSLGASTTPSTAPLAADSATASNPLSSPSSEPYNPFASHLSADTQSTSGTGFGAMSQTSSMNVPTGSQPATEKFSKKASGEKKSSLLTIILGILAVVSLVMAIVFAVLWQQALANQDVVYKQPTDEPTDVTDVIAMMTCTRDLGLDLAETLNGLTNHSQVATLKFTNDQLTSATMLNRYVFNNDAEAEASRWYYDDAINWYNTVANESGIAPIAASVEIENATAVINASATPEQLVGDYIGVFAMVADAEDNGIVATREALQSNYEAANFVCVED